MTQELTQRRTTVTGGLRTLATKTSSWHRHILTAILVLSAFLNFYNLWGEGYGNPYYAAGVKNMLTSWSNFFFVSFDAGFVSVDKPPLGLWIQAASAYLFGFHGWALLFPQAIAGVLCVALLYYLVSRAFGPVAGLIAALALALIPIVVATSRSNTADMLVVLSVLVAAWAVVRATETGRLRWLLLCALIVGLGFNIKMMQAFLVLPAFYLLYLVAAPVSRLQRFVHLGLATIVLLIVSLSWAVVVDLTPATEHPYVGSSQHNSALELASGYNGLSRLVGRGNELINLQGGFNIGSASNDQSTQGPGPGGPGGGGPGGVGENGEKGPLRLLDQQLAGQIGWLLPLAVVGLLTASWQSNRPRLPLDQRPPQNLRLWRGWFLRVASFFKNLPQLSLDRKYQALILWGMWLLTMYAFFSVAGMFHRYYLVMLAPAIAALAGIGATVLWNDYRSPGWRGWLLPFMLVGVAAVQDYTLVAYYEGWPLWLTLGISGLCLIAAGVLAIRRLRKRQETQTPSKLLIGAVAVGILALLIAPSTWSFYTVFQGGGGGGPMVAAGPQPAASGGGPGGPGGPSPGGPLGPGREGNADSALMEYLQANKGNAEYLVATSSAMSASPMILNTDDKVINLNGFEGHDSVFTADE
ncbi:MAG: glycosyltransferase family 39 protein, partial [Rubrobacter sp.]|nr:glycosyltransferase family 39 protein [Rubrobacter sp.]